jgi:hypothetical protein
MIVNTIKDSETGWECYRSPNGSGLVYFVHRKCASTTYISLFIKLNWVHTNTTTIDWSKEKVFSHIKDPLIKHRKGIVESCTQLYPGVLNLVLENTNLIQFISHATSFDIHSFTIERMLGKNATCVHWIPLDTVLNHKEATLQFINQYDSLVPQEVADWFLLSSNKNISNNNEKKLYNLLMQQSVPVEILRYVDFDQCLYDSVTKTNFEPATYSQRIMQLKDQGLSQSEAEEVTDQEVFDNTYLHWNFKD